MKNFKKEWWLNTSNAICGAGRQGKKLEEFEKNGPLSKHLWDFTRIEHFLGKLIKANPIKNLGFKNWGKWREPWCSWVWRKWGLFSRLSSCTWSHDCMLNASYLDHYFQEVPSEAQRKVFTSFDFAFLTKGLKILQFNNELEGGLNNKWNQKGWLWIYPELNDRPKILEQLSDQSGGFLKHLNLLVEENLLNIISADLSILFQSGHNDMFFCSQVASEEEVYKMSILQSLLLSLNLLLPKCKQNAWGWNLIALGLHKIQNFLMKWAQTQHLTDDIKKILSSLLIAYEIGEHCLVKWITGLKKNSNFFVEQIGMCEKFQTAWKETGKDMRVQLLMKCTQQIWIGGGHGTLLHKDASNFGLSFCQYLGFNWGESDCGVGLPKLQILWKNSPKSAMAIHACHYFHMSLPLDLGLKMMGVSFVNHKKKSNPLKN